jgi:hypothetical protein
MTHTPAPTPHLPLGRIASMPAFRDKILSKPELARIESMLERHHAIFENAPPSPESAQREFFSGSFGPTPTSNTERADDFVRWCQHIVQSAQLNPNQRWDLEDAVAQNLESELPLLIELFEKRVPDALKYIVADADASAVTMKALLGLSEKELWVRMAATLDHLKTRVDAAKATGKGWHDLLMGIGIEWL